jgi:hypothetical protein
MSSFELIDMAQFEKTQTNATFAPHANWKEIDNSSEWRSPPSGYEWVECREIDSAFLKPKGWHFATRKTEHSRIFTILQKALDKPTTIGMTISVIKDCQKHTHAKPTKYHSLYFSRFTKGCEVTSVEEPIEQGDLTIYRAEVNKVLADKLKYRILLVGIANDKTDTLQIVKYTCPLVNWEEHRSIAIPMFQNMVVNEHL